MPSTTIVYTRQKTNFIKGWRYMRVSRATYHGEVDPHVDRVIIIGSIPEVEEAYRYKLPKVKIVKLDDQDDLAKLKNPIYDKTSKGFPPSTDDGEATIPANWKEEWQAWAILKPNAQRYTSDRIMSRDHAEKVIEQELVRRKLLEPEEA